MAAMWKVWAIRLGILSATCLGVFVLPFFLPPPYFQGVSASNLAGFNNKVAALAAAGIAIAVFFLVLKWPQIAGSHGDAPANSDDLPNTEWDRLSRSLVIAVVLLWGIAVSLFGAQIIRTGVTYPGDWGYFINRVSMHADFGRRLYTQIEFPYGPLLFYGPIAARTILSPFHVSAAGAYLVTLTLEIVVGIFLVAYVIDHLPMSRRWKTIIFLLLAAGMAPVNMGLNYTFFRFAPPLAFLVMASRRRRTWAAALWIFAGQAVCLGLSPEIGFAFFVSSVSYTAYQCFSKGWGWAMGVAAPVLSTATFLLIVGGPYLGMVKLYAHGVMSFPVEPLPHILVFLFALVWLIPLGLASSFRHGRAEAPMLAALYLVSLALLPAGFGRSDPWHVYWNGLSIFLLSAVAISSRRLWQQMTWCASLTLVFLLMCAINLRLFRAQDGPILHACIAQIRRRPMLVPKKDSKFDLEKLQAIVGREPVATPELVPLSVEDSLKAAGQWTPTFYYFQIAILDSVAEAREIREFNQSRWALIPARQFDRYDERPQSLGFALGVQLPYRNKSTRPIYTIGFRFSQNLAENWQIRGVVGDYVVYENVGACNGCSRSHGLAAGT